MLVKKKILDVDVTNATDKQILEYISNFLNKSLGKCKIFTPNPEIIVYANKYPHFKETLNSAQINLCDGMGLFLASYFLGKPLRQRFTGVEFVKMTCEMLSEKPITMGFLGGRENIAELAAERLKKQYPLLKVGFCFSGNPDKQTADKIIKNKQKIDVLFVAYGFPKQEEWITQYINQLPVRVAVGVGGAFDYISGKTLRAPYLIRFFGFEWLFRLIVQPWRLKRQLALLTFIYLVIKARFN